MSGVFFCPNWFQGGDLLIDLISLFVLLLISYKANYYFRMFGKKKFDTLSISFFLLALAMMLRIFLNFEYYFGTTTFMISRTFFSISIIKILTLVGFFLLFTIYNDMKNPIKYILLYLLVLVSIFTVNSAIFHLTVLFILIPIVYNLNCKCCTQNQSSLVVSFSLIALSQLFFIFQQYHNVTYVLAEFIQLLGYLILLLTFIRIKHGKAK